jgi:hypothetical protein
MTKKNILIGTLALLILAGVAYLWANAQMNGLYNYRSLLNDAPPAAGESFDWAQNAPLTRRVVFILVDALRNDTAQNAELMPTLNQLRAQGAWATSHSQEPSYSAPGYSTIGVGAWPHLNDGPVFNLDYEDIPTWTQDNLFSAAHRAGLKTAVSGYNWFEKLIPQDDVDAAFYTPEYDAAADVGVVNAALPWIESGEYQFIFIHLDQVDTAGHLYGGASPEWDLAAEQVDSYINQIVSLLDLGQDTVVITSDHGQINAGGHGGNESVVLTEPFLMVGAGVKPGEYPDTQMIDIAPTVSVLLGANIPATAQGAVLTEMLTLSADQKTAVDAALDAQKRQLHSAYTEVIGEELPIREDMGIVEGTNFSIDAMLLTQTDKYRRMRFAFPSGIFIFSLYGFFRSWNKRLATFASGALAYVLLFNIYYALIAQRPYSFSSVASENDLIIFNAIGAAVLMTIIWLFIMRNQNAFNDGPLKAAETTLYLIGFTLYIWFLPILWNYSVNGLVPSWYLPNFGTLFVGILSLIQVISIALVGILLTGIATLLAKRTVK